MKKWKKHLAEFVLLFLAVFLGFIAENFRENRSDRSKERELISGMIRNLKTDTANLSTRIASNRKKDNAWDSLLHLATSQLSAPSHTNQFYRNFIAGAFIPVFTPSDATIVQMKEGGSLSLIDKQMVVDSLLDYDYWNRMIVTHNQNYSRQHDNVWAAVYPIIQAGLLMDTCYVDFYGRGVLKSMPPIVRNAQNEQAFFGIVARTLLFTRVNRSYMENHHVRAERLILLLRREYKLDE